jgi:predicted transposase YbfD/YdcC
VSIRAIGCRRDFADKIDAQKADYFLALKERQEFSELAFPATYDSPFITNTT